MKFRVLLWGSIVTVCTITAGCVNTVSGNKTTAIPWITDRVEARYERSLEQVFNAAKNVIIRNGTISSAGTLFNQTNDVRVIEGKAKQDNVWIRIEALEPHLTALTVQTRTSKGASDMPVAHEIDKQIALELAQ